MSWEVERRVRGKIADVQIFLTAGACTEAALVEIDSRLDEVVAVMDKAKEKKAGGEPCGKS